MKIKNLLAGIILLSSSSLFAQKDCKCYDNVYKVPGDIVYTVAGDMREEHYAGILDGKVQFTILKYNKENLLKTITISTFPVADISTTMNSDFESKSKTEDKKDAQGNYILLTLGGPLFGGKDAGIYILDQCITYSETSPNTLKSVMRTGTIDGKFTNGKDVLKIVDQVIADQK